METDHKNYYAECEECKFADFTDFESMKCLKSNNYNANTKCSEFEKIEQQVNESIIASGKVNKIIEEIKEMAVETVKDQKSEIVLIAARKRDDEENEFDYRLNTLETVNVYSSTDIIFGHKIRTEPKNKLIPFRREIIRDGIDLILIKEPNGEKAYIEKDAKKLTICEQCKVKEMPLDILLMSHEDFDKNIESSKIEMKVIDDKYANAINSFVEQKYGKTLVRIKDSYKKDGKTISPLNMISFNSQFLDIKIGRLEPESFFYITKPEGDKKPKKIKTDDGREGILISHPETYKVITPALQQFVSIIVVLLTLAIAISIIVTVVKETGWLIIIGIAVIILGYLVAIFIGAPLYLILNQIIKRL